MDFNFKSEIEDESVVGFQPNILLLILGLAALFILPSFFFVLLAVLMPNVDINLLEYLGYFLGYGSYVVFLFAYIGKDKTKKILKGFNKRNLFTAIVFAVILYLGSILTSNLVTLIFGEVTSNANQDSLNESMIKYPLIVSIFSVVFAPIVEELVFRFTIFKSIAKKNKIIAYIVTILSFAGIHFISSLSVLMMSLQDPYISKEISYQVFFDDLKSLPIYIVAALILTISYDVNKNIATNIMVHAFYNFSQVILMLLLIYITEQGLMNSSLAFDFLDFNLLKNILQI